MGKNGMFCPLLCLICLIVTMRIQVQATSVYQSNQLECHNRKRPIHVSVEEHLLLCSRENETTQELSNYERNQCFIDIIASIPTENKLNLCGRSDNPAAAVKCFNNAPSHFSWHEKTELCSHAQDDISYTHPNELSEPALFPVECVIAASEELSTISKVNLCKYSKRNSQEPLQCFQSLNKKSIWEKETLLELCAGACFSQWRVNCALKLLHLVRDKKNVVTVCKADCAFSESLINTEVENQAEAETLKQCMLACPAKVEEHLCVSVCKGAYSSAPSECMREALKKLSKQTKQGEKENILKALCSGSSSAEPAKCFKHIKLKGLGSDEKLKVCDGVTETGGRLQCYFQAPKFLSFEDKIMLCKRTSVIYPATCINALKHLKFFQRDMYTLIEMCAKAETSDQVDIIIDCTKEIASKGSQWSTNLRLLISSNLCHQITDKDNVKVPFECVQVAKKGNSMKRSKSKGVEDEILLEKEFVSLCYNATDIIPGMCFSRLAPMLKNPLMAAKACKGMNESVYEAFFCCLNSIPKRIWAKHDDPSLIDVCSDTHLNSCSYPASCFINAPDFLTPDEKVLLCAHSEDEIPLRCVLEISHFQLANMQNELVVSLCQGSKSAHSLKCAIEAKNLRRDITESQILSICKHVDDNLEPIKCMENQATSNIETHVLVNLCSGASDGENPHLCFSSANVRDGGNAYEHRALLCSGAVSIAPAECFNKIRLKSLTTQEKILICNGATNLGPGICSNELGSFADAEAHISLCSNAHNEVPSKCYRKLLSHGLSQKSAIQICKDATSDAPERCSLLAHSRISIHNPGINEQDIIRVCKGCQDDEYDPGLCVKNAPGELDSNQVRILCQGVEKGKVEETLGCFKSAPYSWETDMKVLLCGGAVSTNPAECALSAARILPVSNSVYITSLCKYADTTIPAKCAKVLESNIFNLNYEQKAQLCNQAENEGPALCAVDAQLELSAELVVKLCEFAASNAPSLCVKSAPFNLPDKLKVKLCKGAVSKMPATCVHQLSNRIPVESDKVEICRQSISTMPAACAHACPSTFSSKLITNVCKGANTVTPAHCASFLLQNTTKTKLGLQHADIEYCRNVVAYPQQLKFTNHSSFIPLVYNGEFLTPFTVEVGDQFGHIIRSEIPELVAIEVGVFLKGTNSTSSRSSYSVPFVGPRIIYRDSNSDSENQLNNSISRNVFYIHNISLFEPGTFELYISAKVEAKQNNQELRGLRLPLNVQVSDKFILSKVRECRSIPTHLKSIVTKPRDGVSEVGFSIKKDSIIGYLPTPWQFLALSKECVTELETNLLFTVTNIVVQTRYLVLVLHHGPGKIISRVGIPSPDMNAYEILGVEGEDHSTLTKTQLRKAYYMESMKWHPDRWSTHSLVFQEEAQNIFELVGKAYEVLKPLHEK